jgi:hypothetical protein
VGKRKKEAKMLFRCMALAKNGQKCGAPNAEALCLDRMQQQ